VQRDVPVDEVLQNRLAQSYYESLAREIRQEIDLEIIKRPEGEYYGRVFQTRWGSARLLFNREIDVRLQNGGQLPPDLSPSIPKLSILTAMVSAFPLNEHAGGNDRRISAA